ncbi:STAS domain-containing protein [Streptomyces sp. NPDC051452]|uniref:STAS domain-containing protein n=1 Tax=Streptomyces sp. NPDC051452 TaxID=3365654 RepID=UPI0037AC616C
MNNGNLGLHTAPPCTRAPWPSSNRASRHLVLDLTHIDRVDSTGLSTLITLLYATREAIGSLRLARIPGRLMRMVTLTGISRLLPVYATVADALAARPETLPESAAGADHLPD